MEMVVEEVDQETDKEVDGEVEVIRRTKAATSQDNNRSRHGRWRPGETTR